MEENLDAQIAHVTDIQNRYADILLSKPHVVGIAVGFAQKEGQPTRQIALIVMVDEKLPAAQLAEDDLVPPEIEGVRVDVQSVGGTFKAH